MNSLKNILKQNQNPEKAAILKRFFKTGPGEYGEGDQFLGITVPILRKLIKPFYDLNFEQLEKNIQSEIHEERFAALLILIAQYQKEIRPRKSVYQFYCANTKNINNWDLVDVSAPHIVGHYLYERAKTPLQKWAKSKNLWERRIAIVSTLYFIRQQAFDATLSLAEMLLNDPEDLIHKATGWMLREVGKRNLAAEESFLKKHAPHMPRTMLRYAIERFPEEKRRKYLT